MEDEEIQDIDYNEDIDENEYYTVDNTEYDPDYDASANIGDYMFIIALVLCACILFAFVMKHFKKTFKNINLKVGDKIQLGIETKDDTVEKKIKKVKEEKSKEK